MFVVTLSVFMLSALEIRAFALSVCCIGVPLPKSLPDSSQTVGGVMLCLTRVHAVFPHGAVTVTVNVTLAPLARLARAGVLPLFHVSTPPTGVTPPVALPNVTPLGRVSVTTTLLATLGPLLVTVTV
jgi:hypothetical protein